MLPQKTAALFLRKQNMEFLKEHFFAVIISAYFLIINIIGFAMAYADKKKAENGKWRTPESTLFFV